MKKGCPYGTHRVISPKGVLPQPADVIDNTMEIYDNEVLIDVQTLNVDSASFTEIVRRSCNGKKPADIENSPEDQEKVKQTMLVSIRTLGLVPAECFWEQLRRSDLLTKAILK